MSSPASESGLLRLLCYFLRPKWLPASLVFFSCALAALLETLSIGCFYPMITSVVKTGEAGEDPGGLLNALNLLVGLLPVADKFVGACLLLCFSIALAALVGFLTDSLSLFFHMKYVEESFNTTQRVFLSLPYGHYLRMRHGDHMYLAMNASQAVGELFFFLPPLCLEVLRAVGILLLLCSVSVRATLGVLAFSLVLAGGVHLVSKRFIHRYAELSQTELARISTTFSESFAGFRAIFLFDLAAFVRQEFRALCRRYRQISTRQHVIGRIPARFVQLLTAFFLLGFVVYCRLRTTTDVQAILAFSVVFVLGLQRITPSLTAIGNGIVGLRSLQPRLALVLSAWQAPDRESASGVLSPQFTREIRLEQVSFSFDGAREVLHDISLTIRPGETLAIVGESGSGKSTLLDILVGLREPTRGRVSIDGISRDQICPSQWLGLFGVVSQEPFLFHLSVYENIRLGKLEASDEEIIQAARVANAHDFIQQMDHGYQTIVGERGALLSGGQRQRLTIARALLRKPAILVLDEATSSLDSLSEAEVRQAIAMIPNHITVILVAHRLSTVEGADRIVVLKDGQIVESGDHHSLMAEGKEYAALYRQSTVGNGSAEPL